MVARRLVWGMLVVAGSFWLARAVRAGADDPRAPAAGADGSVSTAATEAPRPAASAVRRPFTGYAAEAARTATRLPPEEREARAFLRTAALAARFEADAARLAASRARSSAVQEFAADLVRYHESIDPELLRLLHVRAMAPPLMDNTQRKALNRLAKLQGPKFDREFIELVAQRRQREDVQLYERAVAGIADPVLKGWIDRQLPTLREQQVAAERLSNVDGRRVAGETVRPVRGGGPAAPQLPGR